MEAQDAESTANTQNWKTGTAVDIPALLAANTVKELTNVSLRYRCLQISGHHRLVKIMKAAELILP